MAITNFRHKHYFLSNMYPFKNGIETPDGVKVYTSEQLYLPPRLTQRAARLAVESAENGFEAKKLFNQLQKTGSSVREDWEQIRVPKMRDSVMVKFAANPDIREELLATGEEELIEGNDRDDTFWGISPISGEPKGENMLGKILMEARESFRQPDFSVDIDTLVKRIFE
jgi:ribA/ribD-fused uncharacterized protein